MEENKLHYHMKVRVFRKEGAFGPGVAELMHHVEETGSLSEACRCMGMAYSKGWRIMKHAEEDLGFPLMEGSRGGSRGKAEAETVTQSAENDPKTQVRTMAPAVLSGAALVIVLEALAFGIYRKKKGRRLR